MGSSRASHRPRDGWDKWRNEGRGFVRAFSGAYLFGIPLLYTMETWWIGQYGDLWKLLVFLGLAFLVNLYLARSAGFRDGGAGLVGTLDQAIDAMAVGLVASAAILLALNRIGPEDPPDAVLGMVIVDAMPLSIGAAIANSILGSHGEQMRSHDGKDAPGHRAGAAGERDLWLNTLRNVGAMLAGGVFIGLPIAPTEEVQMLAAEMTWRHELALMGLSLLLGYTIVFEADFARGRPRRPQKLLRHPMSETLAAYLVSLATAALVLYLYDRVEPDDPPFAVLAQVIVLGLPVMIGGAAGRLVS